MKNLSEKKYRVLLIKEVFDFSQIKSLNRDRKTSANDDILHHSEFHQQFQIFIIKKLIRL